MARIGGDMDKRVAIIFRNDKPLVAFETDRHYVDESYLDYYAKKFAIKRETLTIMSHTLDVVDLFSKES